LTEVRRGSIIPTVNTINEKSQTIKIWKTTLKKLRLLYAYTGKQMVILLDELVSEALEKYQKESK